MSIRRRRRRRGSSQYRNPLNAESRWKNPTWVRGSVKRLFWPWTTGLFQLSYNLLTVFFIQCGCVLYCWLSFFSFFLFPFSKLALLGKLLWLKWMSVLSLCLNALNRLVLFSLSLSLSDLNPVYKCNGSSHECWFINTVFIVYTPLVYVLLSMK